MKKIKWFLLILFTVLIIFTLWFYFLSTNVQKNYLGYEIKAIDANNIFNHLENLSRERFTSDQKNITRDYIKKESEKLGYNIHYQEVGSSYINIIAEKGSNSKRIIIGAHYDTISGTVGADDNASSVSTLLVLMKELDKERSDIRFIFFDGEEDNLKGSRYYAKDVNDEIKLMISLESIGYINNEPNSQKVPGYFRWIYPQLYNRLKKDQFRGDFSAVVYSRNTKEFIDGYESCGNLTGLKVYSVPIFQIPIATNFMKDLFRSDHTPFIDKGIPAVMITDTANFRNNNYHTSEDSMQTINIDFIAKQVLVLICTFR